MKFTGMSPVEVQFVRLYIVALRRDYEVVRSVLHLMSPAGLLVENFIAATKLAAELQEMQRDFDSTISRIQKKHQLRKIETPPTPTLDELVDLFSLSFFKMVTVVKTSPESKVGDKYHDGWFSGKPEEWKKTLMSLQNVPKNKGTNLPDLLSNFFQIAMKFFPFHNNKWSAEDYPETKKLWPPPAAHAANDYDDDEVSEDDDDDDDDYPFGWLFEDEYDD